MNKQELIKKYEYINHDCFRRVDVSEVLADLRQLDEPQKPVVPKYVAKWFEEHKHDLDMSICHVINSGGRIASLTEFSEFELWFSETLNPIFTLVSMLQFGYTVEEKRYTVKIKAVDQYLVSAKDENFLGFLTSKLRTYFTRKELEEAGFGWVFDCEGIEIEEVEG